MIKCVKTVSNK